MVERQKSGDSYAWLRNMLDRHEKQTTGEFAWEMLEKVTIKPMCIGWIDPSVRRVLQWKITCFSKGGEGANDKLGTAFRAYLLHRIRTATGKRARKRAYRITCWFMFHCAAGTTERTYRDGIMKTIRLHRSVSISDRKLKEEDTYYSIVGKEISTGTDTGVKDLKEWTVLEKWWEWKPDFSLSDKHVLTVLTIWKEKYEFTNGNNRLFSWNMIKMHSIWKYTIDYGLDTQTASWMKSDKKPAIRRIIGRWLKLEVKTDRFEFLRSNIRIRTCYVEIDVRCISSDARCILTFFHSLSRRFQTKMWSFMCAQNKMVDPKGL